MLQAVLLGRECELKQLNDRLGAISNVGGSVILIRGEAGIGKSSLVREFTTRYLDESRVLFGWCDDLMTPQPMGPFRDISRVERSLVEPLRLGDRLGVMEATLDLLSDPRQTNIVVLEDTQWADEATLDAIKYIGRRSARSNGLLLLTYRDGEVDQDHPLRGVVGELPPQVVERISLGRLATSSVAAMLNDTDLDVDEIMTLTDGNPLFVNELLNSGVEHVPASVQDAVLARAAKLSIGARRLLDLVSVVPGEAKRRVIDDITAPTYSQIAECERQGLLLVLHDRIAFRHELTRRAIESSLSQENRSELNQLLLDTIVDGENWSQLVHHAAEARNLSALAEFAPKAARAAMEIESHREAAAHFRILDEHLDLVAESDRAALMEDWARAEYFLDTDKPLALITRAIELHRLGSNERALARALAFAVKVAETNGEPTRAESYSLEAIKILELYPPSADLAFALTQQSWLRMMRGDDDDLVRQIADRAIEIAALVDDELILIQALAIKGSVGEDHNDINHRSVLENALMRAKRGGYREEEIYALILLAGTAADTRNIEGASDYVQRASSTAARYEIRHMELYANAMHAEILLWQGKWDAAEDMAGEALGSQPNSRLVALRTLATIQSRRGRAEAGLTLDEMWSLATASGELQHLDPGAAVLAEHMWLTGQDDPEQTALLKAVMQQTVGKEPVWPSGAFAFWMWKLGHLEVFPDHLWDFYLSIMQGEWRKAADFWQSKGAPYEQALALMHGDSPAQIEAVEIFETIGATAAANRVRQELFDQGVRLPRGKARATRDHGAGLTARQAEVLDLLAQGLTNARIADQLFVSLRTVENHVSAILMKFDVSNRDAAVDAARSQGLLKTS